MQLAGKSDWLRVMMHTWLVETVLLLTLTLNKHQHEHE